MFNLTVTSSGYGLSMFGAGRCRSLQRKTEHSPSRMVSSATSMALHWRFDPRRYRSSSASCTTVPAVGVPSAWMRRTVNDTWSPTDGRVLNPPVAQGSTTVLMMESSRRMSYRREMMGSEALLRRCRGIPNNQSSRAGPTTVPTADSGNAPVSRRVDARTRPRRSSRHRHSWCRYPS